MEDLVALLLIMAVFVPFISAVGVWIGRKSIKGIGYFVLAVCALEFCLLLPLWSMTGQGSVTIPFVCGLGLSFQATGFRSIFALLSAFAWVITSLYALSEHVAEKEDNLPRYDCFLLLTLGATMGIFLAADLFTVFVFFEIMSLTSFMWVVHRQTKEAFYAAGTYLGLAIAGGLAILMGLFLLENQAHTLVIDELGQALAQSTDKRVLYVAAGCLFAGFGTKAGAFPLHVWLPMSYTQAPTTGTALLSAILSKTGVFGILLITMQILYQDTYWGMFLLLIGLITMVLGGLRGVVSDNFKTTLAYSSMSQIGFILFGIGMMSLLSPSEEAAEAYALAAGGTFLHMVNHSLIKLVLFLVGGMIFAKAGSYKLNQIRGFGRKRPFLQVCFLAAALGVGGIPLGNGYVSKTLLHESIVEYQLLVQEQVLSIGVDISFFRIAEWVFLLAGGLTIAYMTKLYLVVFVQTNKNEALQRSYDEKSSKSDYPITQKAAVAVGAILLPLIGILPQWTAKALMNKGVDLMGLTGFEPSPAYFSFGNLTGALTSIVIGAVVYLLLISLIMLRCDKKEGSPRGYHDYWPKWLNLEKYVYRAVFYRAVPFVLTVTARILDSLLDWVIVLLRRTVYQDKRLPYELPEGNFFTHELGIATEGIYRCYCRVSRREYTPGHFEHRIALKSEDFSENFRIIERSLSFGLFMFCIGLGLTMVYLLFVN